MRGVLTLAVVLAGCATGTMPSQGDDDDAAPIDAADITEDPPDASDTPDPPDAAPTPEVCTNTLDDDGDGMADCLDDDCDAHPSCATEVTAVEMLCNDGADNDSNGQTDCTDARCAWACTTLMTACGTNRLRAYTMTPLPQAIPDVSTVNASVAVSQTGTIVVAAARFNATHTFDADLDLTLGSPAATVLDLTSDNGSTGDNYTATVFLDAAATAVTAGAAPFTGSFQPEAPLSGLIGQSITGTWSSTLTDDLAQDSGTWSDLSIALCVSP